MIQLTRLNGCSFTLNVLLIEQIESLPDTTITLTTGKKIVVMDSVDEVRKKAIDFMREIPLLSLSAAREGISSCSEAED
ncbi:flagellar FlbD family protein [Scopulibacillus cellulosilyticus]|uniref:Flagellar FlbD family protein n=1 Tax=Scopulibacillus cellulosilyticus TaxID=2665665 RepID=A0ABW2PW86_9BACL